MSGGPKHLWSGDWESESQRPSTAPEPAADPEPEPQPEPAPRRWNRRQIALALYAGVAAAAVTVALVTSLGGSTKPRAKANSRTAAHRQAPVTKGNAKGSGGGALLTPAQACHQNPAACPNGSATPVVSGPSADWLGMQIVTSPAGVVISTVRLGSPADRAGLEPGDQIEQVDNHQIDSVTQLRSDTAGLKIGAPITIDVLRSSVTVPGPAIPMTQRPTIHP